MAASTVPRLDCVLAIPCYQESQRLPPFLDELARLASLSKRSIHIQLIDDGSGPVEQRKLVDLAESVSRKYKRAISTHILANNHGKGFAIRHGWINAPDASLFGFVDADGAVPAHETIAVLEKALETPSELTIASRYLSKKRLKRKRSRRLYSFGFRLLFRLFYRIDCTDTQCGLKFVPSDFFREHAGEFRQNRWGLDLELILKAADHALPIREISIEWTEATGSKVRLTNVFPLIRDMLMDRI